MVKMMKIILIIVMAMTTTTTMKNIWAVTDTGEGRGDLIARELSYSV